MKLSGESIFENTRKNLKSNLELVLVVESKCLYCPDSTMVNFDPTLTQSHV